MTRVGIGHGDPTIKHTMQSLFHRERPFDLAPDAILSTGRRGGMFCARLTCFLAIGA